jgi:hypothetical protein
MSVTMILGSAAGRLVRFVGVWLLSVSWTLAASGFARADQAVAGPADELSAGRIDPGCVAQCVAAEEDADRCNTICAASPAARDPLEGQTDWRCVRRCLDDGGTLGQCRRPCTQPPNSR